MHKISEVFIQLIRAGKIINSLIFYILFQLFNCHFKILLVEIPRGDNFQTSCWFLPEHFAKTKKSSLSQSHTAVGALFSSKKKFAPLALLCSTVPVNQPKAIHEGFFALLSYHSQDTLLHNHLKCHFDWAPLLLSTIHTFGTLCAAVVCWVPPMEASEKGRPLYPAKWSALLLWLSADAGFVSSRISFFTIWLLSSLTRTTKPSVLFILHKAGSYNLIKFSTSFRSEPGGT